MNEKDRFVVGDPMPAIAEIVPEPPFRVKVAWSAGLRKGSRSIADLAPLVLSKKLYAPLREDAALFNTVHPIDGGRALAWGDEDQIDVPATTVEQLAKQS